MKTNTFNVLLRYVSSDGYLVGILEGIIAANIIENKDINTFIQKALKEHTEISEKLISVLQEENYE